MPIKFNGKLDSNSGINFQENDIALKSELESTNSQLEQIASLYGDNAPIIAANSDESNLEVDDYTALPSSKLTDGKLYIVFPNS
jgi:hypothetical protein